jgi:hypothetical protein
VSNFIELLCKSSELMNVWLWTTDIEFWSCEKLETCTGLGFIFENDFFSI